MQTTAWALSNLDISFKSFLDLSTSITSLLKFNSFSSYVLKKNDFETSPGAMILKPFLINISKTLDKILPSPCWYEFSSIEIYFSISPSFLICDKLGLLILPKKSKFLILFFFKVSKIFFNWNIFKL